MGTNDKQMGRDKLKECLSLSFAQREVLFAFAKLLLQSCSGIPIWKMSPAILGKTIEQLAWKAWTGGRFQLEAAAPVVCSHHTLVSPSYVWNLWWASPTSHIYAVLSTPVTEEGGKESRAQGRYTTLRRKRCTKCTPIQHKTKKNR